MVKQFKTIDEQLNILRSRGLKIEDETVAAQFLLENNYYRISGYSLTLRKNDVFAPTATFQNIMDIYNFDRELRNLLLKFLEIIEVKVKSIFAYEFTKLYGATGYLKEKNFIDADVYNRTLKKVIDLRDTRCQHEVYLKHFMDDLHEDVPLWALVDIMTLSDISFFYSISQETLKKELAIRFGLKYNKRSLILGQMMHGMTIIRNLCAHGSRLYNRLFEHKATLNKKEKELLIKKDNGEVDNAHLYGFIIEMKRLLSRKDFLCLVEQLRLLTEKYPFVRMSYYGFRDDWQEKLVV